ncbi:MAG: recombinase family protein, partial [Actinomycetota bacterium]|nr:recombinase family protein [Actinomycetota bacterium]
MEAQAERLAAYVKSQEDWELPRRFSDPASGATTERPESKRALAEARAARFDLLLVYRVDPLSRTVRGLVQLLEDLDDARVAFRSVTEPFDTTPAAGRMMVQMLGVFAEFERATIVDRVIAGMERKAASGGWCGASRPFGYDVDPKTGCLMLKADATPLVPVFFDRYAHGREGARALAIWLNEAGHRNKASRPWSHTAVLTVLHNPVYIGKVFFRDALHDGPTTTWSTRSSSAASRPCFPSGRGTRSAPRPPRRSYCRPRRVQQVRQALRRDLGSRHPLTVPVLHVLLPPALRHEVLRRRALPAEELDSAVLDALLRVYERTDLFDTAISAARRRARSQRVNHDQELAVVDAGITKAEDAIERYLSAIEAGTLSGAQCGRRLEGLAAKVRDLRVRREELLAAMEHAKATAPDADAIAAMRHHIEHALTDGSVPARKALLRALVHEIRVEGRDRVVPWFRVPGGADPKVRALARSAPPGEANPVLRRVVRLSRRLELGSRSSQTTDESRGSRMHEPWN